MNKLFTSLIFLAVIAISQSALAEYMSPQGNSYKAKINLPGKKSDSTDYIEMSFISPDVVKITYIEDELGDDYNNDHYFAWRQDKDLIAISDGNVPLRISDDGRQLISEHTGVVYDKIPYCAQDSWAPQSAGNEIFVFDFGHPWILATDGSVTSNFTAQNMEKGQFTPISDGALRIFFTTDPAFVGPLEYSNFILVGDTVFRVHSAFTSVDHIPYDPVVTDFTYSSADQTVTVTGINGSSNVEPFVDDIFDSYLFDEGTPHTPTVPIAKLPESVHRWVETPETVEAARTPVATFTVKGEKYLLLNDGTAVTPDRARKGSYEVKNNGEYTIVIVEYPLVEGRDAFLVVGDNVYSIDVGCCACSYRYDYDDATKTVTKTGGCDDEEEVEKIPLSKMKRVAKMV